MIHEKYYDLLVQKEQLLSRKNEIDDSFYNGIFDRYKYPVLTREHTPIHWSYDLNQETNPFFMERLGINGVFNSGAIFLNGKYYLVPRVEGNDRKSFFAVAESDNGIDGFRFWDYPILLPDTCPEETNVYDMRLTQHEDGYIYGVFCSESKDMENPDLSAAVAAAGIVRTKDLKTWERLPNLKTLHSPQQRNVVLHPYFVDGKYAFYTRPMDGFIETGSGGGIGFGLCEDINGAVIDEEIITSKRKYHTLTEVKNGAGCVPIKTDRGFIHIAHGVRNTAAGLRYVIYAFATDLEHPEKVIAEPSGLLIGPRGEERVGDVSNVVFTNGAIVNERNEVFIYYASSDTRLHVATTTIEKLIDYVFETPADPLRSRECVAQRCELIDRNLSLFQPGLWVDFKNENLDYCGRIDMDREDGALMVYPASFVRMKFTGDSLKAIVTNQKSYCTSTMGWILDGKEGKIALKDSGKTVITIAENLGEGEHEICFFKRMDSCHMVTFHGFEIGGTASVSKVQPQNERRIEVYGDSVSAGEVSEAVHCCGMPDPENDGEYSNSYYSYAWLTARRLGARLHNIAQGGIALLEGTGYFHMPDTRGMEWVYDKMQYNTDLCEPKTWDFKKYTPQVVILAFGQNDNHPRDIMKENPEGEKAKHWREKYKAFIRNLMDKYPLAHFVCTTTILCHDEVWDQAIATCVKELESERVHHFMYSLNGKGTPGHIRIPEAEKMSEELAGFIESLDQKYGIWECR